MRAMPFLSFMIHVLSSYDAKVRNSERERKSGHYKTAATRSLTFFFSIKAYVKRSDIDTKYANKLIKRKTVANSF